MTSFRRSFTRFVPDNDGSAILVVDEGMTGMIEDAGRWHRVYRRADHWSVIAPGPRRYRLRFEVIEIGGGFWYWKIWRGADLIETGHAEGRSTAEREARLKLNTLCGK